MTTVEKKFVSLWDLQGEMRDEEIMWTYEDVRGAFEDEHPHSMVDASDAYVLTVYPFGRDDERPEDYDTEDWETGLYGSTGSPRADWLPAMRRVADGRVMVVREDEATFRVSTEWVVPA